MLTRLRVQGFKNLLDVDVRFGPFTCIAGLNAAGKSNLFDVIRFLHLLTQHPIMEAAKGLRETRGRTDARSLFTSFGDYEAPEIRIVADLLIRREVEDDFGTSATAATTSVRYEVAFRRTRGETPERLTLVEESLVPTTQRETRREIGFKSSKVFLDSVVQGRRTAPFISTHLEDGSPQIQVHQEGHGGRRVAAPKSSRTVLGALALSDYPTLLAVHREMESWQTLLLEPSAMRSPSYYSDPQELDERGAHLPSTLERLRKTESQPGRTFARLANRLAELIDEVRELRVMDDERTETLILEVLGDDGIFRPARDLSDGTLRFIALATLLEDPEAQGLICLEEPENGIHPSRIPAMIDLLQEIACDPEFPIGDDNPLRQVMVNTHSPKVVDRIDPDDLVFVSRRLRASHDSEENYTLGRFADYLVPVNSWRGRTAGEDSRLSLGHLQPYFKLSGKLPQQLGLPFSFK